jgi:hypothetical protein
MGLFKPLEAAVTRRHAEAFALAPAEPLGAIYLFGYTIEIRLKCAYYRLEGIPSISDSAMTCLSTRRMSFFAGVKSFDIGQASRMIKNRRPLLTPRNG